jgi:predicted negative regulator of RcsB-dependent stress response
MRVLFASENYDEALALANIDYPESFAALYEELKGDLYTARGELDKARAAYDSAILHSPDQANRWLRLKRDDLGNVTRTEPAA